MHHIRPTRPLWLLPRRIHAHLEKRTFDATPDPKLVVAVGDCACDGGIFGESYATCCHVSNVIPVDTVVSGCLPEPVDILRGILTAVRRRVRSGVPKDA